MVAELTRLPARRLERRIRRTEEQEAWGQVIYLAGRGHLSVVAERPDLSHETFGAIQSIANRRLRQLDQGGPDDAA